MKKSMEKVLCKFFLKRHVNYIVLDADGELLCEMWFKTRNTQENPQ